MGRIVTSVSEIAESLGIADPTMTQCAVIDREIVQAEGLIMRYLRYDPVYAKKIEYYPRTDNNRGFAEVGWDVSDTAAFLTRSGGVGYDQLQLQRLPVRSIVSLRLNDNGRSNQNNFTSDYALTEGEDFWPNYELEESDGTRVCKDGILYSIGRWPLQPGSVRIEYWAGYTALEFTGQSPVIDASPIYAAVINESIRLAKAIFLQGATATGSFVAGNIVSERLGDYSYSLGGNVAGTAADRSFGGYNSLLPQTKESLHDFVNWAITD